MMDSDNLSDQQKAELIELIRGLNEKLELSVQKSTNHAFNVGCSVSMIPLAVLVGLVFLLSRFNWIIALVALVFSLLAALGLATLVASFAKKNSADQTYRMHIAPDIERYLSTFNLPREEFDRLADRSLPSGALLRDYLEIPPVVSADMTEESQI